MAQPGEDWIAMDVTGRWGELATGIWSGSNGGSDLVMYGGAGLRYDVDLQSLTFIRMDMGIHIDGRYNIILSNKKSPNISAGTCARVLK